MHPCCHAARRGVVRCGAVRIRLYDGCVELGYVLVRV